MSLNANYVNNSTMVLPLGLGSVNVISLLYIANTKWLREGTVSLVLLQFTATPQYICYSLGDRVS